MISIFEALKAGKSLKNKANWKIVGVTSQAIAMVLTFVVNALPLVGVHLPVDKVILDSMINPLANGASLILFALSLYFIPATTETIGVIPSTKIGTGD